MPEMRSGDFWGMPSTCVQGGIARPLGGGYQADVMMEAHSPAQAWQHMPSPMVVKQEPMEEDHRNDSGITSGSDFHSSSPGSDNSQDYHAPYTSPPSTSHQPKFFNTPVSSGRPLPINVYQSVFNPLTPPTSEPLASPKEPIGVSSKGSEDLDDTLTSSTEEKKASVSDEDDAENPLRRLQMSFEKGDYLPNGPLSPKNSENSNEDEVKSGDDELDEENLRLPKVNSHGKVKTFKCKQCDFVAITKLNFWEHSKVHIKSDKLLTCPKCPFVTEYKHHLEYHLRNHFGSKPFKCDKCNYSCVNKSMLNSHMKSHSNIYQYRCSDCNYATKYCHSLKLHLRKYGHKPAMVLNPDGTPNPLPIIDVYGTRRGPKMKSQHPLQPGQSPKEETEVQNNPFAQILMRAAPQLPMNFPFPFPAGFPHNLANPLLFPNLMQFAAQENRNPLEPQCELTEVKNESPSPSPEPIIPATIEDGALDLSKSEPSAVAATKNRRKGKAFRFDRTSLQYNTSDESDGEETSSRKATPEPEESSVSEAPSFNNNNNNNTKNDFVCQFCCIAFGDLVLYTMHMGYHGYKDPFTCNMCGEQCSDKVAFFLHIARNPHT